MLRRLALVLLMGWSILPSSGSILAAPLELNHQGRLTDALGDAVTGSVAITFRLYDDSTGGVPLWTETHAAVSLVDGRYNLRLGSLSPLSADDLASPPSSGLPPSDRYLEVEVGGEVLSPRTKLVSTPYSVLATRVDGDLQTSPGELLMSGGGGAATGTVGAGSLTVGTGYSFGHSQGANVGVGSLRVQPDSVSSVHSLDVDGDGIPDLGFDLTGTTTSNRLKIFVDKNADGTIGAGELSELSKGRVAHSQTLDTDLDGNPELSAQTVLTDSSLIDALDCDDDDDGISDATSSVHFNNAPSGVQIEIVATRRDKSTGGRSSMASQLNDSASSTLHAMDLDGDGISESNVHSLVTSASPPAGYDASTALVRCDNDSDDDGLSDAESELGVIPGVSWMAIKTKGTGADKNRSAGSGTTVSDDSLAVTESFVDWDGDGAPDVVSSLRVGRQLGLAYLKGKEAQSSVYADSAEAGNLTQVDADGDGNPEASAGLRVAADSTRQWIDDDSDDDGVPDADAEMGVKPGVSWVAIKTKGTGADRNRVVGSTNDSSAVLEAVVDSASVSIRTKNKGNVKGAVTINQANRAVVDLGVADSATTLSSSLDLDGDGLLDVAIIEACTVDSVYRETSFAFPDAAAPTYILKAKEKANKTKCGNNLRQLGLQRSSSSEISCDTSAVAAHVLTSSGDVDSTTAIIADVCTVDSVYHEATFSFLDGVSVPVLMTVKEKGNRQKCGNNLRRESPSSVTESDVSCDSAAARTTWMADNFTGSIASLTLQASTDPLANPIEHSSGAHLTPGGTWTNASDKNLKENFASIDGEELLAKLDQLDISEWNYKSEPDAVKHIGPTAQDFQRVFGVGSDGSSISTIDPAGIALAAIKALNEKTRRVDELEAKVAELSRILNELVASKQ